MAEADKGQLDFVGNAEFGIDGVSVVGDGGAGNSQRVGDLIVGLALGELHGDLALSWR